jgi:hypothetical protein
VRRLSPVNGPRSTSTATIPGVIVMENANADYGVTVNLLALVAVPPEVVTAMVPGIAPGGTKASTSVSVITCSLVAAIPPKVTFVEPVRVFPLIATDVPTGPLVSARAQYRRIQSSPPGTSARRKL